MKEYIEGGDDFCAGKDFWANPYTTPKSNPLHAQLWFYGWCNAKRLAMDELAQ